ncbi:hypothetical protein [Rossellomorea aquimaris]|nr:hypothetical protein [Rossellomorea aquimaris]
MKKYDIRVSEIGYIHDEQAADRWFEIYIDLLLESNKIENTPAYDEE